MLCREGKTLLEAVFFWTQEVKQTFEIALAFIAGYLAGSVPVGLLVSKAVAGIDIRRYGTGNIGAANIREHVGVFPAALVALSVFLQGLIPPWIVHSLGGSEWAGAGAAIGAVVGYGWSVFLRFKGGRAVGTATGAATAISPGGFVALLIAYVLGALLRQTSLGVLLGFIVYAAYVFHSIVSLPYRVASLLLLVLIVARRLEGVRRDLERGPFLSVVLNLLLFQRRPERIGADPEGENRDSQHRSRGS